MIKKSEKPKLGDAPVGHPSIFQEDRSEERRVGKECRL